MVPESAYSSGLADPADPKAVLEVCLCHNVRRASRAITRHYDLTLAPAGLTAGQFFILAAVASQAQVSLPILREILALDRTTLTRSLKPMENKNLIDVTAGAGRRAGTVRLTREGASAFREAGPLWRAAQKEATERIGTARAGQLITGLAIATVLLDKK